MSELLRYDNACHVLSVFSKPYTNAATTIPDEEILQREGRKRDSLFSLIAFTKTSFGLRLLKSWIWEPLSCRQKILERQVWVSTFVRNAVLRCTLRDSSDNLTHFPDLEKIVRKLGDKDSKVSLYELVTIYHCLLKLRSIQELLMTMDVDVGHSTALSDQPDSDKPQHPERERELGGEAEIGDDDGSDLGDLKAKLTTLRNGLENFMALIEEVVGPTQLTGGTSRTERELWGDKWIQVKSTFTPELSSLHEKLQSARARIEDERQRAAKHAGLELKNFHLERSKVHGLHFRVTKKQANAALKKLNAADAPKKPTTLSVHGSGYLFVTYKLAALIKDYERAFDLYSMAQEKVVAQAVEVAATYKRMLLDVVTVVAKIDCLSALAHAAAEYDWCCPDIIDEADNNSSSCTRELMITGLRHPIVEAQVGSAYVPSDISFKSIVAESSPDTDASGTSKVPAGTSDARIAIVTGPNTGGKSTFIRAVALCVILAQMGSYVPASSVRMSLFDQIITRVGATDSTIQGVSTFMAEMLEVSAALRNATSKSLVIIDELGRGTSTHDGFGIAWAVLERFAISTKCCVLFATHFHELTTMEGLVPGVKNYHVKAHVLPLTRDITMLYQLFPGPSEKSYGVAVARLAQFPEEIVSEAEQIAEEMEKKSALVTTATGTATVTVTAASAAGASAALPGEGANGDGSRSTVVKTGILPTPAHSSDAVGGNLCKKPRR